MTERDKMLNLNIPLGIAFLLVTWQMGTDFVNKVSKEEKEQC